MELIIALVVLLLVLVVLVIKVMPTEGAAAPTTAEEFINDATGLDIFPTDKD